jgi:nitrogen regulatory protein PII
MVSENVVDFLPKLKLLILMHDDQFISVVSASTCAAQTVRIGQGKLAASIEDPDRIRTKEHNGDVAL